MDDASDLTRLPGLLDYSTNAAQNDIFVFYQDKLTAMVGKKARRMHRHRLGNDIFHPLRLKCGCNRGSGSGREFAAVTVMIPVKGSAAAATTNPNVTPTAAATVDISSIKLPKGLSIYPGATN